MMMTITMMIDYNDDDAGKNGDHNDDDDTDGL